MAVTKFTASKLGEITSNFIMNDFEVYLMNTSATGGFVSTDFKLIGYTASEKTIRKIKEQFTREAKIPRVPIYTKTLRIGLEADFAIYNFNEEIINVLTQSTSTSLGATGTRYGIGTTEAAKQYRYIRFATTRDDGKHYCIDVVKADMMIGETTFGGEENAALPISLKAYYNPRASATSNLYQELLLDSTKNATAAPDTVGY